MNSLPSAATSEAEAALPSRSELPMHACELPTTVLLVDDHPLVCAGVMALLEGQRDMRVVGEAADGVGALEAVASLRPELVIMDLMLPRIDGIEATQQIKRTHPETRVLALTGLEEPGKLWRALEAGASGVVRKDAAADELLRAIRLVARGERYLDPALVAGTEGGAPDSAAGLNGSVLSERETEVLKLLAAGHTAKEMSARLSVGVRTLETYRARAMKKLALTTRAEIVRYAALQGWLGPTR